MRVYVALISDRHRDPDPVLFTSPDTAVDHARTEIRRLAGEGHEHEVEEFPLVDDVLYAAGHEGGDHNVMVVPRDLSGVDIEELRKEIEEVDALRDRLGELLTGVANALKGPPPELVWHDWSDLPRLAAAYASAVWGCVQCGYHNRGPVCTHCGRPLLCPDAPHRGPEGPNEDIHQCPTCLAPSHRMRPEGQTYGLHLPDCSLPERHPSYCQPGGDGHPPAPLIRGYWPELERPATP